MIREHVGILDDGSEQDQRGAGHVGTGNGADGSGLKAQKRHCQGPEQAALHLIAVEKESYQQGGNYQEKQNPRELRDSCPVEQMVAQDVWVEEKWGRAIWPTDHSDEYGFDKQQSQTRSDGVDCQSSFADEREKDEIQRPEECDGFYSDSSGAGGCCGRGEEFDGALSKE